MPNTALASIGWSANANAFTAGQAAARIALQRLPNRQAHCAIAFGSSWFDQSQLFAGIHSVLESVPVVGGSTAGEITPDGPKSHGCVVLALAYEDLAVSVGFGPEIEHDPRLAGYQAAQLPSGDGDHR